MALSENRTAELVSPDVAGFVSRLATAWRSGEVRPTHRQAPKPGRRWRTRPDPFAGVWPVLLGWLEEPPDLEAKAMLKRLQASGYGEFPDGQLRTLQRRVRVWRMPDCSTTGLRSTACHIKRERKSRGTANVIRKARREMQHDTGG